MPANVFGSRFVVSTFGESHGPALGAVVDGCPSGVRFDRDLLRRELARRRPGAWDAARRLLVSGRREPDEPEVLSGVLRGVTLGTPIALLVRNADARPQDYAGMGHRPGHADDLWERKFGLAAEGGGRASGRETVSRVMAGAVARMFLKGLHPRLRIAGFARQIGPLTLDDADLAAFGREARPGSRPNPADAFAGRFPSRRRQARVAALLSRARLEGRSWGGVAEVWIDGSPACLGRPVFGKLKAELASAFMGVGGACGFEVGAGFGAASCEGSAFHAARDPLGARYGGIRGGLSTGERITLRAAFKPAASVGRAALKGRHDPCIVPRAVPVLEAMSWLVLADQALLALGEKV